MKTKFKILLLFNLFLTIKIQAQNLVLNHSCEQFTTCPNTPTGVNDQNNICFSWNAVCFSADYFNSCSTGSASIPQNYFGYQIPKSGNGYLGLWSYIAGDIREYIESQLTDTLQANVSYCVQFYSSLADSSMFSADKLGGYFSDSIVHPSRTSMPYFVHYTPQIEDTIMNTDTTGWTRISGVFTALGGEKIMTIGNFRNDSATNISLMQNTPVYQGAYYYIDDVSVETVLNANAGNDTSIISSDSVQIGNNPTENATYLWQPATGLSDVNAANPKVWTLTTTAYVVTKTQCSITTLDTVMVYSTVGINENNTEHLFKLYPNPSDGNITLEYLLKANETGVINIYSLIGELTDSYRLNSNTSKLLINGSSLKEGIYMYEVLIDNKKVKTDRIVIIK